MAYTGEPRELAAQAMLPDNSADMHPAFAAHSPETLQAAVGHAARAETHVPGRDHAGCRQQTVRRSASLLPRSSSPNLHLQAAFVTGC